MKRIGIPSFLMMIGFVACLWLFCSKGPTIPENALSRYLDNGDRSFSWEVKDSFDIGKSTAHRLLLISQTWREIIWKHQLIVLVPSENLYDGALLFISGGSNRNGEPKWSEPDDEFLQMMSQTAEKNNAVVSIINQVPNQPLFNDLYEDEIISFTLHNYRHDKDFSWPLLFPMVKSAVRAMDAVQDFAKNQLDHDIARFVVAGASKRGWTTWLTASQDPRVVAIGPMVIDVLNMPVQMDYQVTTWGDYSPQIEDYVKLGIPQDIHTEDGSELTTMIDPYSYRSQLTVPKMIFIGTNDEYWPVDAVKHYFDEIPGDNSIHYVANAGHDLGDGQQAVNALSAFFAETLQNVPHPECNWILTSSEDKVTLTVETDDKLVNARTWTAESQDRDFRDESWISVDVEEKENIQVELSFPQSGYKAFYMDLMYPHPNGGEYSKSTRMVVVNADSLFH